jgi:hypothetical protein
MNPYSRFGIASLLLLPPIAFACSHHSDVGKASGDPDAGFSDSGTPDEPEPPDAGDAGSPLLDGKLLAGEWLIGGVTADDWIVVHDMKSAPDPASRPNLRGPASILSARTKALTPLPTAEVEVDELVVFAFGPTPPPADAADPDTARPLSTWTSAGGLKKVSDRALQRRLVASADGAHIAFVEDSNPASPFADGKTIVVAAVDGSARATNHLLCGPAIQPAGGHLLARAGGGCTTNDNQGRVDSIDLSTGAAVKLFDGAGVFDVDLKRGNVLALQYGPVGGAVVIPVGGGAATKIADGDVQQGLFIEDGTAVVLHSKSIGAFRSSIASPSPVTLVPDPNRWLAGVSPDGKSLIATSYQAEGTVLRAMSTSKPGVDFKLGTVDNDVSFSFTDDSSLVIWGGRSTLQFAKLGGALYASNPVDGSTKVLAADTWKYPDAPFVVSGTRVLFGSKSVEPFAPSVEREVWDVYLVDAVAGGTPTLFAKDVRSFALTHAKDHLVYTTASSAADPGVFIKAIP